jgi:maltooligosyltrehalose trehalohydrolase
MTDDELRVWAPYASRVDVLAAAVAQGGVESAVPGVPGVPAVPAEPLRAPMTERADGWWAWLPTGALALAPALEYAFSLDGGDPRPDPRSAWQPHGVHGPSRTFDTSAHAWGDAEWRGPRDGRGLPGGVVYELHVGTFSPDGTFDAASRHLDHLVDLGVDVVEVMPVAAFDGPRGWGYDGVALYAVQDAYGGPAALQRFVDACHAHGLGVCLDVVYNHLGPTGNYLAEFGPYFTDAHATPWGSAVNLDGEGSPEVRRWMVDNALRWFRDFHVDALRLDAVHELRDDSPRHLLAQLSDEAVVLASDLGRPLDLVAESDLNDPVTVTPTAEGGLGMTAQWADDVHHALHVALTGETQGYYADFAGDCEAWPDGRALSVLAKTLTRAFLHDGRWSSFRGSAWGAPVDAATTSGHRFVAYLQNHDQVGNRAVGDRIGGTLAPGQQAIGAALYLLSPFTPMLFMGEEWRASTPFQFFTSFEEEDLAESVRVGRRGEFASHGWAASDVPDPQDPATRERSALVWSEVDAPGHVETVAFYRRLLRIRREEPQVASGDLRATTARFDEDAAWFVLSRGGVHVVANLSEQAQVIPFETDVDEVLATWGRHPEHQTGGLRLDGHDVTVVRCP